MLQVKPFRSCYFTLLRPIKCQLAISEFKSRAGRVQAEGDNFCDLKILCIYFFNVKLGLVG